MTKSSASHVDPATQTFRVASPCGRVYEVPWSQVREDYLAYLIKEDGLSREQALARVTRGDVDSWFYEQFDWSDVERYGTCVQQADAAQIRAALNAVRADTSPGNCTRLTHLASQ